MASRPVAVMLVKLDGISDKELLGFDVSNGRKWSTEISKLVHACTRLKNGGSSEIQQLQVYKDRYHAANLVENGAERTAKKAAKKVVRDALFPACAEMCDANIQVF